MLTQLHCSRGVAQGQGRGAVFFSTFEKQLDAKRRLVVPMEFRTALAGLFDGSAKYLGSARRAVIVIARRGSPGRSHGRLRNAFWQGPQVPEAIQNLLDEWLARKRAA